MLAIEHVREVSAVLASGERANAEPVSLWTLCLPGVTTVIQDVQLQAGYELRRYIINIIIFKDLHRLRDLLLDYRQLVCLEPHRLLKLDQKMRYMDDMVDAFIRKWTFKSTVWSRNSASRDFLRQHAKLIRETIKFVVSAKSIMQYGRALNAPQNNRERREDL